MQTAPTDVILTRLANALIRDAEAKSAIKASIGDVLDILRNFQGGLWVGGRITLTREQLLFEPNGVNAAVHDGLGISIIPLDRIVRASDRFGVLTRIVDVELDDGNSFSFRCFGARDFARRINAAKPPSAES